MNGKTCITKQAFLSSRGSLTTNRRQPQKGTTELGHSCPRSITTLTVAYRPYARRPADSRREKGTTESECINDLGLPHYRTSAWSGVKTVEFQARQSNRLDKMC
ncbi:hypothetical protein J6590_089570 [Homalodisca vitripennis]|nr:hypothetical protein J6590_089570 [Homalodisca vitripennis]